MANMDGVAMIEVEGGNNKPAPATCWSTKTKAILAVMVVTAVAAVAAVMTVGMTGGGNCGFALAYSSKRTVCVEVPPKLVKESGRRLLGAGMDRRLQSNSSIAAPTAAEQSMTFYCAAAATGDEKTQCEKYCSGDHIFIEQVFLVEDEDDKRKSWSGKHVRVVIDEEPQTYDLDYALGCTSKDDYLAQDFSDRDAFNCGYSEIGYDLYYRKSNDPSDDCDEEKNITAGNAYCYARMSNLLFGPFLQTVLRRVQSGDLCPGVYTESFPKDYDSIIKHCIAEYKVDFVIPVSEAPATYASNCSIAYTSNNTVSALN